MQLLSQEKRVVYPRLFVLFILILLLFQLLIDSSLLGIFLAIAFFLFGSALMSTKRFEAINECLRSYLKALYQGLFKNGYKLGLFKKVIFCLLSAQLIKLWGLSDFQHLFLSILIFALVFEVSESVLFICGAVGIFIALSQLSTNGLEAEYHLRIVWIIFLAHMVFRLKSAIMDLRKEV